MIKQFYIVAIALLLSITFLSGCGEKPVESDKDFLSSVRKSAKDVKHDKGEAGFIDPSDASPPTIELEFKEIDLGFVSAKERTIKEFNVYNRGKTTLVIRDIKTTCGCTVGKMKENEIKGGAVGILVITLNPNRFKGFFSKKVLSIYSNDPINTQLKLPVTAQIKGEVIFSEKLIDFGVLKKDTPAEKSIRLTQTQPDEVISVVEIEIPKEMAEFVSLEVQEVPASEWEDPTLAEHLLVGRVKPGLKPGTHKFNAKVILNHQRYEKNIMEFLIRVEGPYKFIPDAITLRKVTVGTLNEGVMKLLFSEVTEVKSVSIDNENIQVTYRPGADGQSIEFDLLVAEQQESRLQKGNLSIVINSAGEENTHVIAVALFLEKEEIFPDPTENK